MRDINEVKAAIKSIKTKGANLDKAIQEAAIDVIQHVALNNEASLACQLYQALPNGSRRNALVAWMLEFAPIKVATGKNKEAVPLLWAKDVELNLEGAETTLWYNFKKEKTLTQEFDLDAAFKTFMKRVAKAVDEGKIERDAELVQKLVALV